MIDLDRLVERRVRPALTTLARWTGPRRTEVDPAQWHLGVDARGRLVRHGTPLEDLAAEFGSPLHVVDGVELERSVRRHGAAVAPATLCVSYAMVGVAAVLDRLHRCGVDAVVASTADLDVAASIGLDAARIVVDARAPSGDLLRRAATGGFRVVVVGSDTAVERLAAETDGRDVGPVRVGIGIELSIPTSSDGDATGVDALARRIADLHACVRRHRHLRPTMLRVVVDQDVVLADDAAALGAVVVRVLRAVEQVAGWSPAQVHVTLDTIVRSTRAIGPVEAKLNQAVARPIAAPDPRRVDPPVRLTRVVVDTLRSAGVTAELSVEPGPSLTARSGALLTTVLDVKTDRRPHHVILDAGINLATRTLTEYHQIFDTAATRGRRRVAVRLAGPICTPADVLYANVWLPRPEVGDVLAIMDTGADFVAASTSFSFPQPAVVLQREDGVDVVRTAETFERLVALDIVGGRADWSRRTASA